MNYECSDCGWTTTDEAGFNAHLTLAHTVFGHASSAYGGMTFSTDANPTKPDPKPKSEERSLPTGNRERFAVTAAEYAAGRAVLDALPPGVYLHCGKCKGWFTSGTIWFVADEPPVCEACH